MITGAADSHKLVSHSADKYVVVDCYGAVSWDCDSDVLSMHWSVCSFVSNNSIAGGHRCRALCLSGFSGFRKTALPWYKLLQLLKMAALYRCHTEILLAKRTLTFLSVITVMTSRRAIHRLSAA